MYGCNNKKDCKNDVAKGCLMISLDNEMHMSTVDVIQTIEKENQQFGVVSAFPVQLHFSVDVKDSRWKTTTMSGVSHTDRSSANQKKKCILNLCPFLSICYPLMYPFHLFVFEKATHGPSVMGLQRQSIAHLEWAGGSKLCWECTHRQIQQNKHLEYNLYQRTLKCLWSLPSWHKRSFAAPLNKTTEVKSLDWLHFDWMSQNVSTDNGKKVPLLLFQFPTKGWEFKLLESGTRTMVDIN